MAYTMLTGMHSGPWLPGPAPMRTDRPDMPGYGIGPADAGGGLLSWDWAVERLEVARNYWVATAARDGTPHLAAVWGVWLGGALYFSTGGQSVKARNLTASARCSVAPENAAQSLVVQGVAERVGDTAAVEFVRRAYIEKYGEGFPDVAVDPLFGIAPLVVIGIVSSAEELAGSATRWQFTSIDE